MLSTNALADRSLYCLLQIHPAAPLELISAVYWRLAAQAQAARGADRTADQRLNGLTIAYRILADPAQRHEYDGSIGLGSQSIAPAIARHKPSLFSRLLRRRVDERAPDHYELLRVDPSASAVIVDEAYPIMRGYYLRLVRVGVEPELLLDLLEEAYAVTSDPVRRMAYDVQCGRVTIAAPSQPQHPEVQDRIAADG